MKSPLHLRSVHRRYLGTAYERGELLDQNGPSPEEILKLLALSEEEGEEVLDYLVEAGLVVWPAKGQLMLTEPGLRKAEDLERRRQKALISRPPKKDRAYLPPLAVVPAGAGRLRAAGVGE